ncbi:alpha/beta fold hydrolase [Salinicoccus sp. HZC-1]|uniref:alpha/beta fold hydrolase n=1 Tax=Salinicoccus sp. HZC-1 TaxID=3385497 RepID=UPI00398ACB09
MKISEQYIENEGRHIRVKVFMPENPICAIQVMHGMAEHMERYNEMNAWFAMNDCMVVMHNHRGHGPEETNLGHFDSFDLLISDAAAVSEIIPAALKKFVLGHSMGSIAARRLLEYSIYDGGIIVGTGNKDNMTDSVGVSGLSFIARLNKAQKSQAINTLAFWGYDDEFPGKQKNRWLCGDSTVVGLYNEDPLCGFQMTNGALYEILKHIKLAQKQSNLKSLSPDIPILLIGGKEDPFSNKGRDIRALARTLIRFTDSVTVQLYDESRHEVLFEKNREQVYNRLFEWVMRNV